MIENSFVTSSFHIWEKSYATPLPPTKTSIHYKDELLFQMVEREVPIQMKSVISFNMAASRTERLEYSIWGQSYLECSECP